ncbi:MAG: galT [Armatimonadetes bacterium]|nr:galT [Armatimonadota bacterium]
MSELRWHPLLREWVITSTERQDRTFLPPKDYCPLCPERADGVFTEVPAKTYHIVSFLNRFPSLRPEPPQHETSLAQQPVDEIEELIYVWQDRYQELGALEFINYVYIFENKGEAIGVTLNHPHGQLYAFPFLPPKIEHELESLAQHRAETGRCLVCDVVAQERQDGRRLVVEGSHFYAGIPFYARYPYELHIWAKEHRASLAEFSGEEVRDLARVLKAVMCKYDALWGFSMPYMMVMKQLPTDGRSRDADHFRIEFYPPLRTANKLKYLASVESGAGTFINDTLAEVKAGELRDAAPIELPE